MLLLMPALKPLNNRTIVIKRLLTVFFLLLLPAVMLAQKEVIELKNSLIHTADQKFYIHSVVDGRGTTDDIGYVRMGSFNKRTPVDLKDGVETSLKNFYRYAITNDTTLIPIAIRVVFFHVSERTDGPTEIGTAELKVEFYRRNDQGKWGKVFETEAVSEETASDVTSGHERRIRKVLENVILQFNNSQWQTAQPEYIELKDIRGQKSALLSNTIDPKKKGWVSLISAHAAFGSNAEGWGVSYIGFPSVAKGNWSIPYSISYDKYVIDPGLVLRAGYRTAQLTYGKIGVGGMRKIGEDFHFFLNFNVPIGQEELTIVDDAAQTSTINYRLVLGLEPTQSFYFISRSKVGFFLGAGLYERFLSSKVYKFDIGLKIEGGFKF
ncbi:MAG: hypothetical protein RLZZ543_247 [Bacteroidota bacterium]|jgi:hypothetical protein